MVFGIHLNNYTIDIYNLNSDKLTKLLKKYISLDSSDKDALNKILSEFDITNFNYIHLYHI